MPEVRYNRFVSLLCSLPPEVWMNTVKAGPGWTWMEPLSRKWHFGPFSTLFLMLGINDYQTKGKADIGYWPKIVPLIPAKPTTDHPMCLIEILKPFYEKERFAAV